MWSKERIATFIEDLQSNACLWDVHCADYKNRNKNVMRLFSCKKYEISTIEVEKKSPVSKVSSGKHKTFIASKKTGSSPILCIFHLGSRANFLEQNLKVTFRHPDEIPES
jgi:hypothetical protein